MMKEERIERGTNELKNRFAANNNNAITITMQCNDEQIEIKPCFSHIPGFTDKSDIKNAEYFAVTGNKGASAAVDSIESVVEVLIEREQSVKQSKAEHDADVAACKQFFNDKIRGKRVALVPIGKRIEAELYMVFTATTMPGTASFGTFCDKADLTELARKNNITVDEAREALQLANDYTVCMDRCKTLGIPCPAVSNTQDVF